MTQRFDRVLAARDDRWVDAEHQSDARRHHEAHHDRPDRHLRLEGQAAIERALEERQPNEELDERLESPRDADAEPDA